MEDAAATIGVQLTTPESSRKADEQVRFADTDKTLIEGDRDTEWDNEEVAKVCDHPKTPHRIY